MTGADSWGITSMIWSTFNQFALSGRYTKMNFAKGQLSHITNYGVTGVYLSGNYVAFATAAYIKPLKNNKGIFGINETISYAMNTVSSSLLMFYSKPIVLSKRVSIAPTITASAFPVVASETGVTVTPVFNAMTGSSFDLNLTKRFKLNCGLTLAFSEQSIRPNSYMFMIGTKLNL
jgi:hypothetical protein